MSRGSKIIYIPEKITGSKTKVPKYGICSGLECALEVFEQILETLSQTERDRLKSHIFLSENQEFAFGLVAEFSLARNFKPAL